MNKLKLPIWNLKDFYPSHNSKEFDKDLNVLEKLINKFSKSYKGNLSKLSPNKLIDVISNYEKIEEIIIKVKSYTFLLYCTDQLNEIKSVFYQKTSEDLTKLEGKLIFFGLEINKLPNKNLNEIKNSKYYVWLKIQRKFKKYQKNENIEKVLLDKSTTSSNSWIRLFDETMARMKFDLAGKELNESEILNLISSKNPKTRENAAKVFGKTLKQNIHLFSMITNTLSKDLQIDNSLRGFAKPDSSRHLSNQVDAADVECLSETVKKNYKNLSHRYYKYKARIFKTKKLNYWDRNAPYPNQGVQNIKWSEAKQIVLESYEKFDKRISDIVLLFFKNSWIHAEVVNGKTSGAFAHPTVPSVHPYILLNYQNKVRDVMTLSHELGHGVHQYLANHNGLLLSSTPLTLAETASVFGEMLTFRSILSGTKSKEQRKFVLRSKIEDMLNTVVRQISFYEFEKKIHSQRLLGELSSELICEYWLETQKESLGDSIKLDGDYKYFWAYIPHFIHSPFYVYAYAFGDCLVNSLYAKYEEGLKNFNDKYINLLKSGGSIEYSKLLKNFDLDPKSSTFWQSGLNLIKKLIDDLEELG